MITEYLSPLFHPSVLKRIINNASKIVKRLQPQAIVCRGVSGVAVAFAVSAKTGIPVAVVRKRDGSHSGLTFEGANRFNTYVVIDDLIDSGKTLKKIKREVSDQLGSVTCVGVLLYNQSASRTKSPDKIVTVIMKTTTHRISRS